MGQIRTKTPNLTIATTDSDVETQKDIDLAQKAPSPILHDIPSFTVTLPKH